MEEVKEELNRGWKTAHELRDFLAAKKSYTGKYNNHNKALISMKHHSAMIIQTFDNAISILKTAQLMDPSESACNPSRGSKKQVTTNAITALTDHDSYSWRKYGQKLIAHAKHPREYYRCTNKDQGCSATKQVQIISDNPTKYKIIYQGKHTCKGFLASNAANFEILDTMETNAENMLSFKCSTEPSISKQLDEKHIFEEEPSMMLDHGSIQGTPIDNPLPLEPEFTSEGSMSPRWCGPVVSSNIVAGFDYDYILDDSGQLDGGIEDLGLWD